MKDEGRVGRVGQAVQAGQGSVDDVVGRDREIQAKVRDITDTIMQIEQQGEEAGFKRGRESGNLQGRRTGEQAGRLIAEAEALETRQRQVAEYYGDGTFSTALMWLRMGYRVGRAEWRSLRHHFLQIQLPDEHSANTEPYIYEVKMRSSAPIDSPHFEPKLLRSPYVPTAFDIMVNDWVRESHGERDQRLRDQGINPGREVPIKPPVGRTVETWHFTETANYMVEEAKADIKPVQTEADKRNRDPIHHLFTYHNDPEKVSYYELISAAAENLYRAINALCPRGEEQIQAFNLVKLARMQANMSLALQDGLTDNQRVSFHRMQQGNTITGP